MYKLNLLLNNPFKNIAAQYLASIPTKQTLDQAHQPVRNGHLYMPKTFETIFSFFWFAFYTWVMIAKHPKAKKSTDSNIKNKNQVGQDNRKKERRSQKEIQKIEC